MRIVSSFHDYYDPVQRQGQDQSIIYIRERKEDIRNFKWISSYISRSPVRIGAYEAPVRIIGCCGRLFPMLAIYNQTTAKYEYHYSIEDVDKYINGLQTQNNHRNSKTVKEYYDSKLSYWRRQTDNRQSVVFFLQ